MDNRTASLRLPGGDPEALRIEHRVAGADANPYLLMAAVLAGIHYGISNRIEPPPVTVGNALRAAFTMAEEVAGGPAWGLVDPAVNSELLQVIRQTNRR